MAKHISVTFWKEEDYKKHNSYQVGILHRGSTSPKPATPPDEEQMRLHKMYEQGLKESLEKAQSQQSESTTQKPPAKN